MQDKMLWAAFFLAVATNIAKALSHLHYGPQAFDLGRNLNKCGPPVLM